MKALADVAAEATGYTVGDVETFASLLARRPDANQTFWRAWYFGRIPWDRETVKRRACCAAGRCGWCARARQRDATSAKYTDSEMPRVEEP